MDETRSSRSMAFWTWAIAAILFLGMLVAGVERASAQHRRGGRSRGFGLWRRHVAEEIRRRMSRHYRRDDDREGDREGDWGEDAPEPERPEKGQAVARFVKWDIGRYGRDPALELIVSDPEGKRVSSLIVPNRGKVKDGQVNPSRDIARVAERLKIGDEISVEYTYFKRKYTADEIELKNALSQRDRDPFTFVRATELKRGAEKFLAVTARRNKLSWTFLVPNEEVSAAAFTDADGKPLGEGTFSAPAPRVLKCLAAIRSGDFISLQYKPDDYQFVLSDMRVSTISETGKFERMSFRTIGGTRHDMAMIRVGTRTLSLVLPAPDPKAPADKAARMAILLKNMRPWQPVSFQYRRQDGQTWLDSITVKP